jgi:hypothetical protein
LTNSNHETDQNHPEISPERPNLFSKLISTRSFRSGSFGDLKHYSQKNVIYKKNFFDVVLGLKNTEIFE